MKTKQCNYCPLPAHPLKSCKTVGGWFKWAKEYGK